MVAFIIKRGREIGGIFKSAPGHAQWKVSAACGFMNVNCPVKACHFSYKFHMQDLIPMRDWHRITVNTISYLCTTFGQLFYVFICTNCVYVCLETLTLILTGDRFYIASLKSIFPKFASRDHRYVFSFSLQITENNCHEFLAVET